MRPEVAKAATVTDRDIAVVAVGGVGVMAVAAVLAGDRHHIIVPATSRSGADVSSAGRAHTSGAHRVT